MDVTFPTNYTLKVTDGLKVKTCARSLFKVFITEYSVSMWLPDGLE